MYSSFAAEVLLNVFGVHSPSVSRSRGKVEENTKKKIIENKKNNKKFWEELISCIPLIGRRPNGKRRLLFASGTSSSSCYLAQ
jgi:hypothetical protein